MQPSNQTQTPVPTEDDLLSPEEAALDIVNNLTNSGYSLPDRVAISRQLRKLLRTEAEEAQKALSSLLDSL